MRERLVMLRVIHRECGYRRDSRSQENLGVAAGSLYVTAARLCSTGENSQV